MGNRYFFVAALIVGSTLLGNVAFAAGSPDFERQILPLLYNRCFSCHSDKSREAKAGLKLDSAAAIRESGVIVPGKPEESELLKRISLPLSHDSLMPPVKGGSLPLNEAERSLIRRWIADGAETGTWQKFNHRQPPVVVKGAPLHRADASQVARQIDAIIEKHHAMKGTKFNEPIDDEVFVRRVYLDVAGRIPSLEETTAFLADVMPDTFGKACLLARRLVEHGVRFIEVDEGQNWDTHNDHVVSMRKMMPSADQTMAALLDDLHERGLLESTLVVMATEFGRSPQISETTAGRGHHPAAFTWWLAGGGVHGGYVHGKTEPSGERVADLPVTMPDFNATIAAALGIDLKATEISPSGRPFQ